LRDLGAGGVDGSFAHGSYPLAAGRVGAVFAAGARAPGASVVVEVSDAPQLSITVAALRAGAGSAVGGMGASFGATSTIPPRSTGGPDRVVPAAVGAGRVPAGPVVEGWEVAGQSASVEGRDGEGRDVDDDVAGQSSVAGRDFVGRVVAGQSSPAADRDFVGRVVAGGGFGALAAALAAARAAGLLGSNRGGSVPFLT